MEKERIYRDGTHWRIEGSSEKFKTPEKAMRRVLTMRKTKKKAGSHRFISEKLQRGFRSNWEIELAELLAEQGIKFEYEPKRFYFREFSESYLPDFYLPEYNVWIEVKGYMDLRSDKRCKLFKRYHGADTGFFLVMKEELELLRSTPELIHTYINIAQAEQERMRRKRNG